jgi:hypothetical protein
VEYWEEQTQVMKNAMLMAVEWETDVLKSGWLPSVVLAQPLQQPFQQTGN